MQNRERSNGIAKELAVLVAVILPDRTFTEHPLDELAGLAETVGAEVVGKLTQRRDRPNARTYLGKGKVEELALLVEANDADVVVFDNDLSPAQTRSLEQELDCKVLDRSELILDIFAKHAQTKQSRLAVELAQLQYSLPRLKRMWTHLSRIKNGIGVRGPGEKQLEVDRRLVEKRIGDLKHDLELIQKRKVQQVASRSDRMTVSIIGYTNAGKSTLINKLTDADVLTEDKLFATLDTRTRRWQLPGWGPVLLSDTVGFIRDLPHHLIASFRATLEETRQANLLLHVADASNPDAQHQIAAVYQVLKDIGVEEKDTLLILNKADALPDESSMAALLHRYPNALVISAQNGKGLKELAAGVSEALSRSFLDVDIETGVENGRLMAYLSAHGEILSKRFNESRVVLHCRLPQKYLGRINDENTEIRPHVASENHSEQSEQDRDLLLESQKSDSIEDVA